MALSPTRALLALLLLLATACRATDVGVGTAEDRPLSLPPPAPGWTSIGASVEGRPLLAKTRGAGPWRVYLIAGIHGDERPAVENADRLGLLVETDLGPGVTVRLVRDVNPDGTLTGRRRNVNGVDLNRNWPASNFRPHASRGRRPLSEPEAAAVHTDLLRFDPDLVLALHAARNGPFVNFDGPAREPAEHFVAAAGEHDPRWRVVADMGYATPGSLGSWVGVDGGVPILTVELERGMPAEEAWPALRAGVLAALEPRAAPQAGE